MEDCYLGKIVLCGNRETQAVMNVLMSIDGWVAIMRRGNNGGYASAWLLGDVGTGEIARLELGLRHVGLEKKMDGYFAGSNVAEDLALLRLQA